MIVNTEQAERSVLSALMWGAETGHPKLSKYLRQGLGPSHFQEPRCRKLFKLILESEERESGSYNTAYLATLAGVKNYDWSEELIQAIHRTLPSAGYGPSHFKILDQAFRNRTKVQKTLAFASSLSEDTEFPSERFSVLLESFRHLDGSNDTGDAETLTSAVKAFLDRGELGLSVKTHIPAVNEMLNGGLRAGHLCIVAGRPGMGKSAFAMDLMQSASEVGPCLYFSFEMSLDEFGERFVAKTGKDALGLSASKNLSLITKGGWTAEQIRDRAISFRDECRDLGSVLQVVAIDHIGLVQPSPGLEKRSREQEISYISRNMKLLAGILECPVVLLSQLNRGVTHRESKRPMLNDLRDSGALEQDADQVILLHRPRYYFPEDTVSMDEVILAKVRQGRSGVVGARFCESQVSWRPFTEEISYATI